METSEDALSEILNHEELLQIPQDISKKLKTCFNSKFEEFITAKAIFETNRQLLEQKYEKISKDYTNVETNYEEIGEKLDSANKYIKELEGDIDKTNNDVSKLKDSITRLERENAEFRKQRNTLSDERDALQAQVERRDTEVERTRTELSSLTSQLQTAVTAKCQALAETEEIRSRDMTLDFKEKRLEQERVLLAQQMASLEEELTKRTNELQTTRSEASSRALLTDTRLAQCEEELRISTETLSQLKEGNCSLQRRCDELVQKLDEQRNHELTMHTSYQEEIGAQTRLVNLHKGVADEANSKATEFSSAVKELQNLLEEATEHYGALESKHNDHLVQAEQDLEEKQQKIDELGKELELANDLLKNMQQDKLDHAVEQLAPTAAVASRVLKKGLSLTQIYTQLVEASNDLRLEREENERLREQMDVILREIEEKAPLLQQQREDYENSVTNLNNLTSKMDELVAENYELQKSSTEAERVANHHTKENTRLKTELADLARQVCFLLKEVQDSRNNSMNTSNLSNSMDTDNLASSQIISKTLVTFRDIEELQENNQKLLSIVRTLSTRQEEIEKATDEINSGEMKEKLDRYSEQLTEMQAAQERQAKMLEGVLKQRDTYKDMYQQAINRTKISESEMNETGGSMTNNIDDHSKEKRETGEKKIDENLESKYKEIENKMIKTQEEYDNYRKEKAANERMLGEEVERLRKEAEASSARCCRLKAQFDSANERFNLLQANVVSYKSQIKTLEEKCQNYNLTIGKHEQSLMMLKDETLSSQARLSRAEVQLENMRQERQLLRDSEGRLLKEREIFQRERQTQAMLKADVESIKASLERVQAEGQLRAEQRLDDATRECAALRRRLQEEQDRFRELASHLEKQAKIAQERLKEETDIAERLRIELDESRATDGENQRKLEELNAKIRQANAHSLTKPITGDDNLNKKIKELEVLVISSQSESKSLMEQLKAARQQAQQYCDIAESSETQLREMTSQHEKYTADLEKALNEARVEVSGLEKKIQDLRDELMRISSGRQETDSELREKLIDAQTKLEELDEVKGEIELLKSDLQNASVAVRETEDKYAREMVLHSNDLQTLAKLKEEFQNVDQKLLKLQQEKNAAIEALELDRIAHKKREEKLSDEIDELQKRVDNLDAQNALLHNQIQELSDRTAIMQTQSKPSGNESPNASLEAMNRSFTEEDSKSAEQLLKVMKYLRREKDLIIAKFDVVRAENLRLKSLSEVMEKRLKDTENLLLGEREKSEIDVATTWKHAELLRRIETLNAITDSNRVLREERDSLSEKVANLEAQVVALSAEVIPLRESSRDWAARNEVLTQENSGLKGEATRWRQRANALIEKSHKASPEDWRRLQTERETLSKQLILERESNAKLVDEQNQIKMERSKLEEQLIQLQRQIQFQETELGKANEEAQKLNHNLTEAVADSTTKDKDLNALKKTLIEKEVILNDLRSKELQIRKIAKKYKTQYEELAKTMEEEKTRKEELRGSGNTTPESVQLLQERETQLREEGRQELRQINLDLISKFEELSRRREQLEKEVESMNKTSVEKEERAKQVLKGARTKIMQLTELKNNSEKELNDLKSKMESGSNETDNSELDARLVALKSQMEVRLSRLEHEKTELQTERDALLQRVAQLQRQLSGVGGISATTEPPTANIKPMSARTETPLASIRPMTVVIQSRTAAVLPTTVGAPVMVAPHQQQPPQVVHTTETSSPTSSLTDFQPASTSSSSQTTNNTLRQLAVQPQLSESAESTQREEPGSVEILSVQQQQCQQQSQHQQQQQTVALVSPRVEQQQQQQQQQPGASDQQQGVASSSTQSVSTSQTCTGQKRPRTLDSTASGSGMIEAIDRQDQIPSPKSKRLRQQECPSTASASGSEVEYQVPTSSQRDQDEEIEEGCVVVVDCDEGEGGGNHQAQEEEEFENDPYEEMEEEEELPYEGEVEGERDDNEVEIIMEDEPTGVEIQRQAQTPMGTNQQQQQQSEAISSAGPTGEPPTSFASRSSRGVAPMPRQQQHLLLPQQGYEDGGDDSIVPSTPTLFVPRRGDGFGEAVSSPQVPQGRFTFGDSSTASIASSTPCLTTPTGPVTRAMFGSSASEVAQVVQEGMDDTRMDLTQLEDGGGTGRSVPTTPLQVSPASELPSLMSNLPSDEQEMSMSMPGGSVTGTNIGESSEDITIPLQENRIQTEIISESISTTPSEGVNQEDKRSDETGGLGSEDDDTVDTGVDGVEEPVSDTVEDDIEEESREAEASPSSNTRQRAMAAAAAAAAVASGSDNRGGTARRSSRSPFRTSRGSTRPTPIVWESQSGGRGQMPQRGHPARGVLNNEGVRGRGTRGRRMRGKYPYARF